MIDALSATRTVRSWWTARQAPKEPHTVYLVHGEADSSRAMADRLINDLGWNVVVPEYGERVRVD